MKKYENRKEARELGLKTIVIVAKQLVPTLKLYLYFI